MIDSPTCLNEPGNSDQIIEKIGDPGTIRTCDQQLRRLSLYPLSYGAVGAEDRPPRDRRAGAAAGPGNACDRQREPPAGRIVATADLSGSRCRCGRT